MAVDGSLHHLRWTSQKLAASSQFQFTARLCQLTENSAHPRPRHHPRHHPCLAMGGEVIFVLPWFFVWRISLMECTATHENDLHDAHGMACQLPRLRPSSARRPARCVSARAVPSPPSPPARAIPTPRNVTILRQGNIFRRDLQSGICLGPQERFLGVGIARGA